MLAGAWHRAGAAIFLTPFVATRLAEPSGVNPSLGAVWLAVFGLSGGMFSGWDSGRRAGSANGPRGCSGR